MECYNVESDYIDSLDFLSPPVKRIHNSREVFVGPVCNSASTDIQVFRRHKYTKSHEKIIFPKRNLKTCAESSTSLILQKTSERQILDRCSVVSYTSLHASKLNTIHLKNPGKCAESTTKPLIRVTVIPKSDQVQTAKLLRKRRHTTTRVQGTISNLENSIQTKNVYLVVAGRRKDKIYEIKTTGSATFSSDQTDRNDTLSVAALTNVRQLIQSLNMNQAKTIHEKQLKSNERHDFANSGNDPYRSEEFVSFPHTLRTEKRSSNRSRLRIYGQLGLTNDDRYVLRYGASVNDKPVSDFAQLVSDSSKDLAPMTRAVATHNDNKPLQKDASVQASYEEIYEQTNSAASYFPFGATQGTQVNFNVQVSTRKKQGHVRTNEQNTQCRCNSIVENRDSQKRLKDCQSPLVIISVYPKTSPEDNKNKSTKSSVEIKRNLSPTRHKPTEATRVLVAKVDKSIERRTDGKNGNNRDTSQLKNEDTKKEKRQVPISRSPSPIKKLTEVNTSDNVVASKVLKPQTGKKTIDRYKTLNIIKKNIIDQEKHKGDVRNFRKYNHMQQLNKKTMHNQDRFNEIGINTEQAKAKKALVDNYTKILNKHSKQKDFNHANASNAKARLNVDGENEHFNVLHGRDKLEHNLRIKKPMKPAGSNRRSSKITGSFENLFSIPDKETTVQPMSIAVYKQKQLNIPESERISGLTIRDSLEISHRRGDKNYYSMKNTQTCFATHCNDYVFNDTQYLAPIKHYIGDDCSIYDPIQRDKEIRELLGVDKTKVNSSDEGRPYSCFYRRQCDRSHIAQINLVKLCPCLTNKRTTKNEDTEDNTCIKERCPEKCCPQAPCNTNRQKSKTGNCCHHDNPITKDLPDVKLSDNIPYPNVQAAKQQFHNQIQQQQEQLLQKQMVLQQQQQKLHLQQQQQQLRVHKQDYKTGCDGCCAAKEIEQDNSLDNCKDEEDSCCCDTTQRNPKSSAIYQQLVLNRNIQVFLQVEQFSKQRPIVLSRKQYDKVKKTIQSTILSSRDKRKKILGKFDTSNVSVGEIRKKTNIELNQSRDQEVQTDNNCRKVAKKNKKKSRRKCLSHTVKRNKLNRCCGKKPQDGSSSKECSPPPKAKLHRRFQDFSSATSCSSSCSKDDGRKYFERYQRSNYDRIRPNSGCIKPFDDRYKQRDCYKPLVGNYTEPPYPLSVCGNYTEPACPPSGYGEQHYKTYGNCPRPSKFTCNTEHQTMTDDILCGPSGLIPQRNKAEVNLQQGVGEYRIQQRFNTAQPSTGKIPYKPSEYREPYVTGPGLYRQYNDEVKGFTDIDRLLQPLNDKTLGNIRNNLDQPLRVNRTEKTIEASKEFSGYPMKVEHEIGQRELKTYINNGSQCEIPRRLNADFNLLKTTSQPKNSVQFEYQCRDGEKKSTVMLYNSINNDNSRYTANKTLSSMEIHYTSLAYTKEQRLDLSTTDIAVLSDSSLAHVQSFQTIFRGHRKSPTPNLGTSIFSLYSGEGRSEKSTTYIMAPKDVKPVKKPFLRRLMSCLVMRSARVSELKLPTGPVQELPSVNSSIDSYHISTSLGAVEVSSSIYDTSASFYSNHSILPINSKIKRGFFSSVRGFLTNRKS